MGVFPLEKIPTDSWGPNAARGTGFGSKRKYRGLTLVHGACDLLADAGTKVLAVEDGVVIKRSSVPYSFAHYKNDAVVKNGKIVVPECESVTYALEVQHENFIVRYGEIAENLAKGVGPGTAVKEGQVIGFVGVQCGGTMLHFEMFQHPNRMEGLSQETNPKYLYVKQAEYYRREDLLDPTSYLYEWAGACGSQGCFDPNDTSLRF